jgi:hypothetical protein
MWSLVAVVALTLAAPADAGQAVVLVGRRTAVPAPSARTLALDTSKALADSGVPIALDPDAALKQLARVSVKDSASCNGKRSCLAELGRQLKVSWVVVLSAASMDGEQSVGLELLRVSDEAVVETDSLLLPKKARVDAAALSAFAAKVKGQLLPSAESSVEPAPTPLASDAPKEAKLTPGPVDPPPSVTGPAVARSHVPSFVLGGAGVAALVAGAVMLGVAVASRAPLAGEVGADGRARSTLTIDEAEALNAGSTGLVAGGSAALAASVGLGLAGVLTW